MGNIGSSNYLTTGKSPVAQALANICWYAYLLYLILISFLTHRYNTASWLYLSAGFYLLISVYGLTVLFGARCNWLALKEARTIIFCVFASVVWLFIQTLVPIDNELDSILGMTQTVPPWFDPSSYLSVVPDKTRWLLFTNIFAFAWFVFTLSLLDSRRRVQQLLWTLLAIGALQAGIAIFVMHSGMFLTDIIPLDGHFQVARGWFVNRNHFAAFMNLCLVGGIYAITSQLIKNSRQKPFLAMINQVLSPRVFVLAAVLLIVVAILLSQSRGGILALIAATLAMVSVFSGQRLHLYSHWRRLLVLSVIFVGVLLVFGQNLIVRFSAQSLSLGERITQWSITLDAIKHSWFFGYGGGSYGTMFQLFREYVDLRQVSYNQSHNEYLHIWLEQGLVGLTLWLLTLLLVVRQLVQKAPNMQSNFIRAVLMAASIGFTAAILQAGVGFNLQIVNIRCNFFVIIALIFCAFPMQHRKFAKNRNQHRTDRT
jgi:O-antigen ligase